MCHVLHAVYCCVVLRVFFVRNGCISLPRECVYMKLLLPSWQGCIVCTTSSSISSTRQASVAVVLQIGQNSSAVGRTCCLQGGLRFDRRSIA